ncbi:MAG: glycerol-3-phosphate acyltransferase [Chloroflexota bacterium]
MIAKAALVIIGGYLLGSIPTAYLVARLVSGIDIRKFGSGQIGTSNLFRMTSLRVSLPVAFFDMGKAMIMIWAARLMGLSIAIQVAAGLAAIIGHNWPVFLRFNGGRGIITTLGVILFLDPRLAGIGLTITAIGVLITHGTAVGVLISLIVLPLISWGLANPLALTLGLVAFLLIAIIRRLAAPRSAETPVSRRELMLNRLIHDRDISEKQAWIYRNRPPANTNRKEETP